MLRKNKFLILVIFVVVVISGFLAWRYFVSYFDTQDTTRWQFKKLHLPLIVINVLDKEEYDDAHIKNSYVVSLEELPEMLKTIDKSTKLVFYCANYLCTSSDEAAHIAHSMHFNNVYVYRGGMADWYQRSKENSEYAYEGPAQKNYLKIIITPVDDIIEQPKGFSFIDAVQLLNMMKEYKAI